MNCCDAETSCCTKTSAGSSGTNPSMTSEKPEMPLYLRHSGGHYSVFSRSESGASWVKLTDDLLHILLILAAAGLSVLFMTRIAEWLS